MSAGTSPSGFASLRARFEQKGESTSPPSRGRSPAGPLGVTGDASRPISKVRTSFVAVEPTGQMGDLDASEELGNKGHVQNGDGAGETTTNGVVEKPKTNGIEFTPQNSPKKETNPPEQTTPKGSPTKKDSTPPEKPGMNSAPTADLDKPKSTAEVEREIGTVLDGPVREGETSPLGSILKGSPFEQDEKEGEASKARDTGAAAEPVQSLEQQVADPSTPMTNGKPKEASAPNAGQQPKTKTTPPSAIRKKSVIQPASSTIEKSGNKTHTPTRPAPTTPKNAPTPNKQPMSKKISPKSATSAEPKKEVLKDAKKTTVERPSRPAVGQKAPVAASKPAAKPAKKPGPTSLASFTKPRPKSPTRPVRLPGSATAPTAASAAKLETAPAATAKPRNRVPSNPTSLRSKPARTSLPAGSKFSEKAKEKPKSRLSTASSKAPEGSFLDRMMRPTQSSSQKTHEKLEAKTPPKKANGVKPKRKSDGSEKAKSENFETKAEQPIETAASPPVQPSADSSETQRTNRADNGTDEAAPASAVSS